MLSVLEAGDVLCTVTPGLCIQLTHAWISIGAVKSERAKSFRLSCGFRSNCDPKTIVRINFERFWPKSASIVLWFWPKNGKAPKSFDHFRTLKIDIFAYRYCSIPSTSRYDTGYTACWKWEFKNNKQRPRIYIIIFLSSYIRYFLSFCRFLY